MLTVFIGYWFILTSSYLVIYGSNRSFFIILLGCLGFFIGYKICKKNSSKIISTDIFTSDSVTKKESVIILLYGISFVVNVFLAMMSWVWYREGFTWAQIRGLFLAGNDMPTPLRLFEVAYVIPLNFISGIIFSIEYVFSNSKYKKPLILFLSLGSIILFSFASQGRFVFLYFFICLIITYKEFVRNNIEVLKLRKYITAIFIAIILFTVYRGIEAESDNSVLYTIASFWNYAILPMDLINYYVNIIDVKTLQGDLYVFLAGGIGLLDNVANLIGIDVGQSEKIKDFIDSFSDAVYIRDSDTNSFVSLFTYFYLDMREYGVFMESMIFGSMCAWFSNSKYKSGFRYSLYLLFWIIIAMSPVRWGFSQLSVCACIIYLYVLFRK